MPSQSIFRLMTYHGECQGNEELGKVRLNSPIGKHACELRQDVGVAVQLVHFHIQGCCAGLRLRYGDAQGCWQPTSKLKEISRWAVLVLLTGVAAEAGAEPGVMLGWEVAVTHALPPCLEQDQDHRQHYAEQHQKPEQAAVAQRLQLCWSDAAQQRL
ncbi:MAG: hypothetical protein FRX49_00725 [Trebouxia sp. A1-2]|nr:MAG: hypothetical protein FRX49_00725 [Trebouxia sp. A1-2]